MITSWNRKRSMIFDHFGIIILFDCDSFVERKTFYDFWDSINFTVLIFAVNFRQLPKVMYKPKTHSVQVKIPSQHNLQQLPKTHCESQRGDIHVFRFLITLVSLYSFDCNYFVELKNVLWFLITLISLYSFDCDYFVAENVLRVLIILVSLYFFDCD